MLRPLQRSRVPLTRGLVERQRPSTSTCLNSVLYRTNTVNSPRSLSTTSKLSNVAKQAVSSYSRSIRRPAFSSQFAHIDSLVGTTSRRNYSTKIPDELEERISKIPLERFRNFCIVAHVDHGKSTLSDRLLELTGTIQAGDNQQILDRLDVERERGITVKAQTCTMVYNHKGEDYLLHLVDTPGHVDFRAEVSRSYASCGGALLLVDATKGVQAQTVANFYLAFAQGLKLIPVINKIDMQAAEPKRAIEQIQENFELDASNALHISAKTGLNVKDILPMAIENIPAPVGSTENPLKMLLVDSWYSPYKGVILLVRVFEGTIKPGDQIRSFVTEKAYTVGEVGIMHPLETSTKSLRAGQVGYINMNPAMKNSKEAKIGDTFCHKGMEKLVEQCEGFEEPKPMVFVGAFPTDALHFPKLEESIGQLALNDRSIEVQKEHSDALGQGWRLGFLGTLHCSVFEDRLRQEHGETLILTDPTVPFQIKYNDGTDRIIRNPVEFPDTQNHSEWNKIKEVCEPIVLATITVPDEYVGTIIKHCEDSRGRQKELSYFTPTQVILKYEIPLSELVDDFFPKLKSISKGYATLDYEDAGYEKADVQKLQLLINKIPVDAVAKVLHRSRVQRVARTWVTKFKEFVDRQMFEVVIQAAVGNSILAKERVAPYRKDVTAKLYGGDKSRKSKLLEKQKDGKKKLKTVGNVHIDHKAFQGFLAKD